METRANYALVGLFTLAVIAAAFAFVYWFRGGAQNGDLVSYRLVFTGSVSGLSKGSVVRFNGLRVGEVTEISLIPSDPSRVAAIINVDRNAPIKIDTRARLEYQGLTGVANVQLTGGSAEARPLGTPDGRGMPTIFADRSDFQDILETVQRLSSRVDGVLNRADTIITNVEGPIVNTARNAEAFSRVLAENSSNISQLLSSGGEAAQRVASLAQRLERFTDEAEALVRSVDAQSLNRTVNNIEAASAALANRSGEIEGLIGDASALARRLNDPDGPLEGTLKNAETLTRNLAASSGRIDGALKSVEDVGAKIGDLAGKAETFIADAGSLVRSVDGAAISRTIGNVEKASSALANRSGEIEGLVTDAAALARRLADPQGPLEGTLQNAESFSRALADNSGRIEGIARSVEEASSRIASVAGRAEGVISEAERIAKGIDGEVLARTLGNAEKFSETLAMSREQVQGFLTDASALARRLTESAAGLDTTLADIGKLVRSVDADRINRTVEGAEKFASTLGANSASIDQALKEAAEITAKVNKASDRLDKVLAGAEGLFAGGQGQGVISEIGETARAIRVLAENLDKRTAEVTVGINRFTGNGLRDLETLTGEARRAVGDISRAVRNFERNPAQIITGGRSSIPEYGGRR